MPATCASIAPSSAAQAGGLHALVELRFEYQGMTGRLPSATELKKIVIGQDARP